MKGMDGVITVAIGCLFNNELGVEYNVQAEDYEAQVEACGNKHRAPEEHRCEAEPHLVQRQQSVVEGDLAQNSDGGRKRSESERGEGETQRESVCV